MDKRKIEITNLCAMRNAVRQNGPRSDQSLEVAIETIRMLSEKGGLPGDSSCEEIGFALCIILYNRPDPDALSKIIEGWNICREDEEKHLSDIRAGRK
jgi:hypothetical protein